VPNDSCHAITATVRDDSGLSDLRRLSNILTNQLKLDTSAFLHPNRLCYLSSAQHSEVYIKLSWITC